MHGRPRKAAKPEDEAASIAKAQKLRSLQSQFLSNHHNRTYTKEALELSAKLLEVNPESYTAWNYRKLAVQHRIAESDSDPASIKSVLDEELRVVENALRQNYKSYGAWHHRKWVLSKGHSSIDHELRLLDRLQKADPRNFHAWNYRRFVAELKNRSEEDELNYTTDMINTNISNYSAWHNRSILLSSLLKRKVEGFYPKEKTLSDEFELVNQAIFTDQDDQSSWFYYIWLLDQTVKTDTPLLISSWPANGSDFVVSRDHLRSDLAPSLFGSFHSDSGTFPLALYFSQAVEGVSSATITVESSLCSNSDLIWKPLSTNNSNCSQVWVTHVKLPDKKLQHPETYPMAVSLGHSLGIVSASGFQYKHKIQIAFKICIQSSDTELAADLNDNVVSWSDDNFQMYKIQPHEVNLVDSLDQFTINDDHELGTAEWRTETISKEIAQFRLLAEIECKIGKLTLARLLNAHDAVLSQSSDKTIRSEEVIKLYSDLTELDPGHSCYYKDESSLVLLRQVAASLESLSRHCYQYRDSTGSRLGKSVCLRLNNISLTRLGSTEKLLWVQMLDLSHNELRSVEGLEALQLLSCLNLSHNKLCSITALGPIRLLKSLKVLDVSNNEIGSHSIDTTRYLCPSPLSHKEEIDWKCYEDFSSVADVTKYWEVFLIFRELSLKQLDISGNVISDDQFRSILVSLLPKLKWLNGELLH